MSERIPQTAVRRPGQVRIVFTELDPGNGERPLVSADYFVDRGSLIEFAEGRFVAEKDSFVWWTGPWTLNGESMDAPKLYSVGTVEGARERFGVKP